MALPTITSILTGALKASGVVNTNNVNVRDVLNGDIENVNVRQISKFNIARNAITQFFKATPGKGSFEAHGWPYGNSIADIGYVGNALRIPQYNSPVNSNTSENLSGLSKLVNVDKIGRLIISANCSLTAIQNGERQTGVMMPMHEQSYHLSPAVHGAQNPWADTIVPTIKIDDPNGRFVVSIWVNGTEITKSRREYHAYSFLTMVKRKTATAVIPGSIIDSNHPEYDATKWTNFNYKWPSVRVGGKAHYNATVIYDAPLANTKNLVEVRVYYQNDPNDNYVFVTQGAAVLNGPANNDKWNFVTTLVHAGTLDVLVVKQNPALQGL